MPKVLYRLQMDAAVCSPAGPACWWQAIRYRFISQMQLVLPVLGFNFLQAKPVIQLGGNGITTDVFPIFTYSPSGASAKAQEINGEFVVFKGSRARVTGPQGWTSYRGLRDQLVLEKKLVPYTHPSSTCLPRTSPSQAQAQEL
jgi:hypothetical protein